MMKKLLLLALLTVGCSHTPYVKVGTGYKIQETEFTNLQTGENVNDKVSARIEMGLEYGAITYGISHHSQWFSGAPFNNNMEYSKTEVFIDYTLRFNSNR